MKRSFFIALCALVVGTYSVDAQSIRDRSGVSNPNIERIKANKSHTKGNVMSVETRTQKQVDRMSEKLNLNDKQAKSIYSIVLISNQKKKALYTSVKEKGAGMSEEMRAERKLIMKAEHDAIIKVLNKEQAVVYERQFTRHLLTQRGVVKGKHMQAKPKFKQKNKMEKRSLKHRAE